MKKGAPGQINASNDKGKRQKYKSGLHELITIPMGKQNPIAITQRVHFETRPTFGNCCKLVLHLKKVH